MKREDLVACKVCDDSRDFMADLYPHDCPYERPAPAEGELVEAVARELAASIARRHGNALDDPLWLNEARFEEARAAISLILERMEKEVASLRQRHSGVMNASYLFDEVDAAIRSLAGPST